MTPYRDREFHQYNRYHHHNRIRRDARPNFCYVDGASLRELDQVCKKRIDGRLHYLPAQARNSAMRSSANEMTKEDLTPHNVRSASTLLLLRMLPRTVRAQYKRYWECLHAIQPHQFVFDTPERGNCKENDKERLRDYISKHVIRIEDLREQIDRN